jgi:hypothetical protein
LLLFLSGGKQVKKSSSELKWSGQAKAEHNQQKVVCTAEQEHSLPWNYTQEESRKLTVFCKNFKFFALNCVMEIICHYLILFYKKLVNNQATFAVSPRLKNGSEVMVPLELGKGANVTVKIWANAAPYNHKLTRNGKEQAISINNVRN